MTESSVRRDLVRYSQAMYTAGWVANHDGNLSARIADDRLVLTPTGMSKADVTLDDLVVVDAEGRKRAGRRRPFSELGLHRVVYQARSDVMAVVHAHPPFATAFGVVGQTLPHPFLPEAVVSLGPKIPTVPLSMPGEAAEAALRPYVMRCDAVLLAGNGVLTWGPNLELAYLRLELVEHLARIASAAQRVGDINPLPSDMVQALLAKRQKAGLCAPEEIGQSRDLEARAMAKVMNSVGGADAKLTRSLVAEITRSIRDEVS
ncbi:MAG: class II aldolase/adducin family protein [Myxococcota bacterium]|nr:class II aldolase/adducin family protein [Myxococcota bacterium]